MKKPFLAALLICLAATVLVLFFRPPASAPVAAPVAPNMATNAAPAVSSTTAEPRVSSLSNPLVVPVAASAYIAPTQAPPATVPALAPELLNVAPDTVLQNMRTTFRQYAAVFGGNPVGTNQEITRALMGDNPKHLNFLLKVDGNRVNSNGELVDLWGTPYFFHQLSGTEMEIRSAGPDRKLWTDDDLVLR